MKNISAVPASIRDSVVILRCRGLELSQADRTELQRSEAALGRVFQRIHRIEWIFTGRPQTVELRCSIRALSGEFSASAVEGNARGSLQAVTQKILKQKRRAKTISVTRRRTGSAAHPRAS
jgi:ribosome-associated translation inhibitor RaiA